jgi:hypothetical protein
MSYKGWCWPRRGPHCLSCGRATSVSSTRTSYLKSWGNPEPVYMSPRSTSEDQAKSWSVEYGLVRETLVVGLLWRRGASSAGTAFNRKAWYLNAMFLQGSARWNVGNVDNWFLSSCGDISTPTMKHQRGSSVIRCRVSRHKTLDRDGHLIR